MDKVQINFYGILSDQYISILVQLLAKSVAIEKNILVMAPTKEDIDFIDDGLWRSGTFWLPHCYIDNKLKEHNPIILSTIDDYLNLYSSICNSMQYLFLINPNASDIHNSFRKFEKVFILFSKNHDRILLDIRTLWKELSHNKKYHLSFYQQNVSGKFELKTDT